MCGVSLDGPFAERVFAVSKVSWFPVRRPNGFFWGCPVVAVSRWDDERVFKVYRVSGSVAKRVFSVFPVNRVIWRLAN